jgi:hypothetical protein
MNTFKTYCSFLRTRLYFYPSLLVFFFTSFIQNGYAQTTVNTAGAGTFTVPAGVSTVTIQLWGSGGSGGGCSTSGNSGSGGGGGAYTSKTIAVAAGDIITYTVGAGATPGAAGSNGNNGNATTANHTPTATAMTANGGSRGNANSIAGGTGGTASGGTSSISGANGGAGGANTGGNGGNGGNAAGTGGNGGTNANGTAGTAPGGGGGGAERNNFNVSGGAGANGRIIITCNPIITNLTTDSTICEGSSITITGTNLANATSVTIGGTAVSSITSNTSTQIVAVVGPGTTGTVSVTTIAGTATSTGIITIIPRPSVATNVLPSASAICSGTSISISASSPGNTIYWYTVASNGTSIGNTASDATLVVTPTVTTTYYAEVRNANGCYSTRVSTGLVTVTAAINPTIEFTQGANDTSYVITNMCGTISGGGQNDLDIGSGNPGAGSTYQWQVSYDNGATWVNGPGPTSTTTQYVLDPAYTIYETVAGTYKFRIIITKGGCSGVSTIATLTTIAGSNLNPGSIAGNQYYCALSANPVAFTQISAPAGGNGTMTYQWQSSTNNSNFTSIAGATASTYDAPTITQTTYYRRVAMTNGCSATSNTVTVVVGAPTITLTGANTICYSSAAQSTLLNYSGTTGLPVTYSITWNASPANNFAAITYASLTANSISIAVPADTAAGTYTGTITVTNPGGCTSSGFPFTITVNALPATPSITTNVPSPICPGTSIALTSSTGVGYLWSTGATSSSITVTTAGNYMVKITDANGCQSAFSAPTTVSLYSAPLAPSIELITYPTCTVSTGSIHLENLPSGSWILNQFGTSTSTFAGSTLEKNIPNLVSGTYYFTVTNSNGCISPASVTVNLTASTTIWNGSAWSNGDPTADKCVVFTGDYISNGSFASCSCTITSGNITIKSGDVLTVSNEVNVAGGTLLFENNASLIQLNDNAVNVGTINYKRDSLIKQYDYVYWSSPVSNFTINNISLTQTPSAFFKWNTVTSNPNGGQGNWEYANGDTMTAGKGYIVGAPYSFTATPSVFTATFTGIPNNGVTTIPVFRGNDVNAGGIGSNGIAISAEDDNWNLIGNPYPSAISAYDFFMQNTNIEGSIRLWTHQNQISTAYTNPFYGSFIYNYTPNDYVTYNVTGAISGPSGFNGTIAAGQSFFVLMNEGLATMENVVFTNAMRNVAYDNSQFFKNNNTNTVIEKNRIWLDLVTENQQSVRTLVGYLTGATTAKDRLFDSVTKVSNITSIYTMVGDQPLTIQGRPTPFDAADQVAVGVNFETAGTYSIAIGALDGLFEDGAQAIYLEDTYTQTLHNLRQSPYTFTSESGNYSNRFVLRYNSTTLGNTPKSTVSVQAVLHHNTISVDASDTISKIEVYTITGQLVQSYQPTSSSSHFEESFSYSNGVYIANIQFENGKIISQKLLN